MECRTWGTGEYCCEGGTCCGEGEDQYYEEEGEAFYYQYENYEPELEDPWVTLVNGSDPSQVSSSTHH